MQFQYGNPYQAYFTPAMPDPRQNPPAFAQSGPVDERIWVTGETGAQAYLVAANGFVRLWDSTAHRFYEKQADATGKPFPMVTYEYKRVGGEPESATSVNYMEQIDGLKDRIEALEKKLAPRTKKEAAQDD